MMKNRQLRLGLIFTFIATAYAGVTSADDPPAGQMCPEGSFVIGFDAESNIICSATCGNRVLNEGESCDDGNTTAGDGCSAECLTETSAAVVKNPPPPAQQPAAPAAQQVQAPPAVPVAPNSATAVSAPIVTKIKPRTVVFQSREVKIAITGNGFNKNTTIVFSGQVIKPSVNPAGTELRVTLPTRDLAMGYHAITVSNGPGMETTVKRGLEVF
jgi:cysteine-rich repeat protein